MTTMAIVVFPWVVVMNVKITIGEKYIQIFVMKAVGSTLMKVNVKVVLVNIVRMCKSYDIKKNEHNKTNCKKGRLHIKSSRN